MLFVLFTSLLHEPFILWMASADSLLLIPVLMHRFPPQPTKPPAARESGHQDLPGAAIANFRARKGVAR